MGVGRFYDVETRTLVPLLDGRVMSLEGMRVTETVSPIASPSGGSIGGGGNESIGAGGRNNETTGTASPSASPIVLTTPSPTFLTESPMTTSPTGSIAMNSRLLLHNHHAGKDHPVHHGMEKDGWNDSHDPYA